MIKIPLHLLFIFLVSVPIYSTSFAQSAMNVELRTIEGNYATLNDIKGEKLTVLDFWATWCKPCVKSIPELVKLSEEFDDRGVQFVGVNEDSPRNIAKVRPFANSLGISYPVLLDTDQDVMRDLLVSIFPTLIIMNSEGKTLYTHEGYSKGDEEIIRSKIEELLSDAK